MQLNKWQQWIRGWTTDSDLDNRGLILLDLWESPRTAFSWHCSSDQINLTLQLEKLKKYMTTKFKPSIYRQHIKTFLKLEVDGKLVGERLQQACLYAHMHTEWTHRQIKNNANMDRQWRHNEKKHTAMIFNS